ncbi:hypothetical protein CORC01_13959 [Colletotrichum orchidophilum]|uniref:Uncharacterized protein n=1 Tax=Colletotrichum orchidophilum TaxID=1209926 RepID=A0A1G4ANQ6_9PEZI|nr:hypothetical protein CORC01_13959 [Colletotrichum orchidophilum]
MVNILARSAPFNISFSHAISVKA